MVQIFRDSFCGPCLYWTVPFLTACGLGTNIARNQHLYLKDGSGNVTGGDHVAEREFTLWRDCVRLERVGTVNQKNCDYLETDNLTPAADADCNKFKHTTRATRAFYIMTLIMTVFALLALIAASCGAIGWMIPAILIGIVAVFCLIAIILACYLYDRADKPNGAFCNYADRYVNGTYKHPELQTTFANGTVVGDKDMLIKPDVGPSIPLMIAAWFMNAFAGCWNCALKDGKEAFQKVATRAVVGTHGEY